MRMYESKLIVRNKITLSKRAKHASGEDRLDIHRPKNLPV